MCDHAVRFSMFGMLSMLLNYSNASSGVTRGLSQGESSAELGSLAKTQKSLSGFGWQ